MSEVTRKWRKLAEDWTVDSGDLRNIIDEACDRLEAYECLQKSTQARIKELELNQGIFQEGEYRDPNCS